MSARTKLQAGGTSPHAKPGRFSALMEPSVAAFANWYAGTMLNGGAR